MARFPIAVEGKWKKGIGAWWRCIRWCWANCPRLWVPWIRRARASRPVDPPRPPPELVDDAVAEILLRFPPDEPQHLFRASLVCKPWRRLLTDAAFLRRYRRFHGTPPMLGFFIIEEVWEWNDIDEAAYRTLESRFIPTTSSSPYARTRPYCRPWSPLDCRHGRVLFRKENNYIVWDPIDDELVEELPEPQIPFEYVSEAVLCAVAGCDHCNCHGGPFLVVHVGTDRGSMEGFAHVYSSETGSWGTWVPVLLGAGGRMDLSRDTVVGDQVYFMLRMGARILKFDLTNHHLSVIDPPELELYYRDISLMTTEEGLLGIAASRGSTLRLWSRKANSGGVETLCRVIDLRTLLPPIDTLFKNTSVIGFAEGFHVIIMFIDDDVFIIDLNSERARKVSGPGNYCSIIVPFMSFYTPDCACRKLPLPSETN